MKQSLLTTVLILLLGVPAQSSDQSVVQSSSEPPCKKQLLTLCAESGDGSPVCELIRAHREVTPERLFDFLWHVATLDNPSVREELVCARLIGTQRFIDFPIDGYYPTSIDKSNTSKDVGYHVSPYIRFTLNYESNAHWKKFKENKKRLEAIGYGSFVPSSAGGTMTFRGLVSEIEFSGDYKMTVSVDQIVIESIKLPGAGLDETNPEELAEYTTVKLREAYKKLMQ